VYGLNEDSAVAEKEKDINRKIISLSIAVW
jgi:hypothetical protein